jgi:uncharacterized protein with ACT and thioredoxin-like domain
MKITEILLLAAALIGGAVFAVDNAVWFDAPAQSVHLRMRGSACNFADGVIKCRLEPIGIAVPLPGHA